MGVDHAGFFNTQQAVELETEYPVIPENEYLARIDSDPDSGLKLTDFVYKKGDKEGQTGYMLNITYEIEDEDLEKEFGYKPKVKGSIMLDFANTETFELKGGKGANIALGRLRAALGQNDPSEPWSPPMMCGQSLYITVKHRMYDGRTFADVKDYRAL